MLKSLIPSLLLGVLFIVCTQPLQAQLCQGSLGDPVVNITFGTSNGQPLPFRLTNYTFVSTDCPQDGSYTIIPRTSGCFGNSWHNVNEDHTPGDVNGNMMLINSSAQPSDFYLDTVKNLCGNTTYEFAAWIVNVLRPSACGGSGQTPNLTFRIESASGNVLQTFNTGDIPQDQAPVWKQYGFFFQTPANASSIVLRITNNAPGGNNCGNDLALDDITFRPCGPMVSAKISGNVNGTVYDICQGNTGQLTLTSTISPGYNNPAYQWQVSSDTGATWKDIANATTTSLPVSITAATPGGTYLYRLSVAENSNIGIASCRVASNVITVNVNTSPLPAMTANAPVCEGTVLSFTTADAGAATDYAWSGPAGSFNTKVPSLDINNVPLSAAGLYHLTVSTAKGCVKTDSITVNVKHKPIIENFTPDTTICQGEKAKLLVRGGTSYMWQPASTLNDSYSNSPNANPNDTTRYVVTVINNIGCSDTAVCVVNVLKKPKANAGPDQTIFEGQSVPLQGTANGSAVTYTWSPSYFIDNIHALQPIVSPKTDTFYVLTVQSTLGCGDDNDRVNVRVYKKVIIPNAFSPNGDGINDTWNIVALNTYPEADVSVFNRYGRVVFNRRGYNTPWNGTYKDQPLPVGTYYYVIDLRNGTPKLSGWVLIIR